MSLLTSVTLLLMRIKCSVYLAFMCNIMTTQVSLRVRVLHMQYPVHALTAGSNKHSCLPLGCGHCQEPLAGAKTWHTTMPELHARQLLQATGLAAASAQTTPDLQRLR